MSVIKEQELLEELELVDDGSSIGSYQTQSLNLLITLGELIGNASGST